MEICSSIENEFTHLIIAPLIQPLANAIPNMIKGVSKPKIAMYGSGVFIGFSPSLSPAVVQYL